MTSSWAYSTSLWLKWRLYWGRSFPSHLLSSPPPRGCLLWCSLDFPFHQLANSSSAQFFTTYNPHLYYYFIWKTYSTSFTSSFKVNFWLLFSWSLLSTPGLNGQESLLNFSLPCATLVMLTSSYQHAGSTREQRIRPKYQSLTLLLLWNCLVSVSLSHCSIMAARPPPSTALGNDLCSESSLLEPPSDTTSGTVLVLGGIPKRNKLDSSVIKSPRA